MIPKNGRAFVTGDFNRVPVVIGSNRDEGRLFANGAIQQGALKTPGQFENNLRLEYGDKWQKVKKEYLLKHFKSVPLAYSAVFTDSLFACSANTISKAMSKFTKVYAYEFSDRNAPISFPAPKELGSFGAYHSAEIQYVLQTKSLFFAPDEMTPEQKKLADLMQVAWASFARDGVPSLPSGSKWPEFNPVKANIRRFATSGPETADDFEKFHKCEFWSAL